MNPFSSRWLAVLAAAAAFSAPAQQTIIYSKPADMSADKANSFLPSSNLHAGDFNAPHQLFNDYAPSLPMPQPMFRANDPSVQDALNRRKNWTLLTPQQILGIQTPEEVLGIPSKTSDKNLSIEEQFLLREGRSGGGIGSNNLAAATFWHQADTANPFDDKNNNDRRDAFRQPLLGTSPGPGDYYNNNPLLNGNRSLNGPDLKPDLPWTSVFARPAQPDMPKPTPEQVANMERFQAQLAPSSTLVQTPATPGYSAPAVHVQDPYLQQQPVVNPAGRAVQSLDDGLQQFSRPTGINPLPTVSTPPPTPVATRPSWQAQLPPWMKKGPQAGGSSQSY
jgi:hypothetical protein